MRGKAKTSAIIPAYNEMQTIASVVSECLRFVDEVIVVDDGSTDGTADAAGKSGAIVVKHNAHKGLTQTLIDGLDEALARGAKFAVQIDADGQYSPLEIPKLMKPLLDREADYVLGSRFKGRIEYMPILNRLGNKSFTRIVSSLVGIPLSDSQTGFRAMTREVVEDIPLSYEYTYTQEMIIHAAERGFTIKEVPISFRKRTFGKSRLISSPLRYGFNVLGIILRTYRDYHPMRVFGTVGAVSLLTGIAFGVYYTYVRFTEGVVKLPSFLLSVLLIISGLQFFLFGFLADMVTSMREQRNRRRRKS